MSVFSKQRYLLIDHHECQILHPWTTSCTYNAVSVFLKALKGGSKYFIIIYLFQLLSKRQNYQRHAILQQLISFSRSCALCGFCAGTSVGAICLLRWLLGKHTPYTVGLIPGFLGGGGIFLEDPQRRETDLTLYIAMVTDVYLKMFEDEGLIKLTLVKEFFLFSSCSSLLFYSLRAVKDSYTVLWPVTPHKLPDDPESRKTCPHKGDCLEDIKKTGITYLYYGMAIQFVKVIILNFPKMYLRPTLFLKAFFKLNNLQLPLFAGLYVTLFKGVSCLLRHLRGRDEAWHALPAGVMASFCYFLQPNLSLALIAFSNLSQIVCRELRRRFELPRWHYKEFVFMICMGLLYHTRAAFPHCFPKYMLDLMDKASDGRAAIIYDLVEKHLIIRM